MPRGSTGGRLTISLAVFALGTVWLLARIAEHDIWFHLLVGKEIVRTGHIPAAEFYVYPALGTASGFHEWGFGLLSYLVERAGGFVGLGLLNAALGAGAIALVAAAAVRRGASWWSALLLLGPVAFFCSFRFCYRPESILYLAVGTTLYCLERRWLALLPLMTAAEALFHPSPLILLLIAGCYAADIGWEARRDAKRLVLVSGVLIASVLTIALVPYGLRQLTLPIEFAARGDLTKTVTEFWPTLSTARWWHWVVLAGGATAAVAFLPRRRISDVLLLAGFGYLAFAHVRNVPLFALVAFGPMANALDRAVSRSRITVRAVVTAAALATASLLFFASPRWGVGEAPSSFPSLAVQFIDELHPDGRIVNAMHWGGYLAWNLFPSQLVSSDGRTYYGENEPMRFTGAVLEARPGWREAARARGVTMIATPALEMSSGALVPILAELDADPEWTLVTVEPAGMLFVRGSALPRGAQALEKSDIWRQALVETDEIFRVEGATRPRRAHLARGVALFKLHDFARAEQAMTRYAELAPQHAEAAQFTRLLNAALAGHPEAQAAIEEMYRRGRGL